MNLVTSHPTISPKLTLSGKFWLLDFDLGGNTFLSDFSHFSFLFQLLGGTGVPLLHQKSLADCEDPTHQGKLFLGHFCKDKRRSLTVSAMSPAPRHCLCD